MAQSSWPKADRRAQERTRSSMTLQAARVAIQGIGGRIEGRPSFDMVSDLREVAEAYEVSHPALYRLLRDAAATIVRLDPVGVVRR